MENLMFAVVEIYGKQIYAGTVSEERIGDNSFIRVDVPATEKQKGFTKLFNQRAIFSITPTDEETVNRWLKSHTPNPPITVYKAIEYNETDRDMF